MPGDHVVPSLDVLASRVEALATAVSRLAAPSNAQAPVPGLAWTVRDVVVHLAVQAERYVDFILGHRSPEDDMMGGAPGAGPDAVAAVNAALILAVGQQPLHEVAGRLEAAGARFADVLREADPDGSFRSWEGSSDIRTAAATFLGELLVHGHDVARALQRPWQIQPADARSALHAVFTLLPHYVDPATTSSLDIQVRVRVRGGPDVLLQVRSARAAVRAWRRDDDVSATVAVTPRALLLLAYRRTSLHSAVLQGQVVGWGRQPLAAVHLLSWFRSP